MGGTHPDSAELQRYADGDMEDAGLASHIESCAICREEVAAVRRVTAALSLTSRSPDSLTARIESARSARLGAARRPGTRGLRRRSRFVLLPLGVGVAAALVLLMPRPWRNTAIEDPATSTPKGEIVARDVMLKIVLDRWSQASIDSLVVEALKDSAGRIEIAYVAGKNGSADAELAVRITRQLQENGVDGSRIVLRSMEVEDPSAPSSGASGVTVTILARRGAVFQP